MKLTSTISTPPPPSAVHMGHSLPFEAALPATLPDVLAEGVTTTGVAIDVDDMTDGGLGMVVLRMMVVEENGWRVGAIVLLEAGTTVEAAIDVLCSHQSPSS